MSPIFQTFLKFSDVLEVFKNILSDKSSNELYADESSIMTYFFPKYIKCIIRIRLLRITHGVIFKSTLHAAIKTCVSCTEIS